MRLLGCIRCELEKIGSAYSGHSNEIVRVYPVLTRINRV
jgi:hypothetical protein